VIVSPSLERGVTADVPLGNAAGANASSDGSPRSRSGCASTTIRVFVAIMG
jgi:hypothetical protein